MGYAHLSEMQGPDGTNGRERILDINVITWGSIFLFTYVIEDR
jgi:hypothetical protein